MNCDCEFTNDKAFINLCDTHRKVDDLTRERTAQQTREKVAEDIATFARNYLDEISLGKSPAVLGASAFLTGLGAAVDVARGKS